MRLLDEVMRPRGGDCGTFARALGEEESGGCRRRDALAEPPVTLLVSSSASIVWEAERHGQHAVGLNRRRAVRQALADIDETGFGVAPEDDRPGAVAADRSPTSFRAPATAPSSVVDGIERARDVFEGCVRPERVTRRGETDAEAAPPPPPAGAVCGG